MGRSSFPLLLLPLLSAWVLSVFCVRAQSPPFTEQCGEPDPGDTTAWLETKELGFYPSQCPTPNGEKQIILQVYKPPVLPFQLQQVCGMLFQDDNLDPSYSFVPPAPENMNVTFYVYGSDKNVDRTRELPRPGNMLQQIDYYPVKKSQRRHWYPATGWQLAIWEETIFVGVGWDPCDGGALWRNYVRAAKALNSTPWYVKKVGTDTYISNEDRGLEYMGRLGLRVFGRVHNFDRHQAVDAGWTCAAALYSDHTCHCGCGLPDPDCMKPGSVPVNNEGHEKDICFEGKWVQPRWDARCPPRKYNDGVCDCGCGIDLNSLPDPDCFDSSLTPHCPNSAAVCNRTTWTCTTGWKCGAEEYSDSTCTCKDCGIVDPACLNTSNPTTCDEADSFVCVDKVCRYPRKYVCPGMTYRDGRTCNCGCGIADPDCETIFNSILGCPDDGRYSCDIRNGGSKCVLAECGNNFVDLMDNEECDGGVGCTECRCVSQKGYRPTTPRSINCEPICGDGIVRDPEECERGYSFCDNATCTCMAGHDYNPDVRGCTGCGNRFVEVTLGEECDSGFGCNPLTCKCLPSFMPQDPLARSCKARSVTATVIAVPIVVVAVAVTVIVLIVLYFVKWRKIAPPKPTQGNDVLLMEVGEDGSLKVAQNNESQFNSSTAGQPPGTIGGLPPGTVSNRMDLALAVNIDDRSHASGAATTTTPGAGRSNQYEVTMMPATDPSLGATQAICDNGEDSALAQTMFVNG